MDYYKYTLHNVRESAALDKTLLDKGENFFFYSTLQNSVLIGPNHSLSAFNENDDGVIVVRHFAGSGPWFTAEGSVKVTFILNKVDIDKSGFVGSYEEKCKDWIMKSLKDLGIETTTETKKNDIFLNGKKICGVSIKELGEKLFFGLGISLFIDFEMAARVMNITKHTTDLKERGIGINQVIEVPITSEQIFDSLKNNLNELWGIELKNTIDTPLSSLPNFQKNLDIQNDENWIKYGRSQKPDFT